MKIISMSISMKNISMLCSLSTLFLAFDCEGGQSRPLEGGGNTQSNVESATRENSKQDANVVEGPANSNERLIPAGPREEKRPREIEGDASDGRLIKTNGEHSDRNSEELRGKEIEEPVKGSPEDSKKAPKPNKGVEKKKPPVASELELKSQLKYYIPKSGGAYGVDTQIPLPAGDDSISYDLKVVEKNHDGNGQVKVSNVIEANVFKIDSVEVVSPFEIIVEIRLKNRPDAHFNLSDYIRPDFLIKLESSGAERTHITITVGDTCVFKRSAVLKATKQHGAYNHNGSNLTFEVV